MATGDLSKFVPPTPEATKTASSFLAPGPIELRRIKVSLALDIDSKPAFLMSL